MAAGAPAAKLGIGAGFYGECWTPPVTAPHQAPAGSHVIADDNKISYTNIVANYFVSSLYHYDATAEAPYLSMPGGHGPEGCAFPSYEDPTSITAKRAYTTQKGLGGVIARKINEGVVAGKGNPLLTALGGSAK